MQKKGVFEEEKAVLAVSVLKQIENKTLGSISDAYSSKSTSLATFRKYMSKEDTKIIIFGLLQPTLAAINVGRGISNEGIESFVDYIMEEFYFLKFEELKLFFQMVKLGKFGKMYDRLDLPVLCEMLREYDSNRTGVAVAASESNKRKEENPIAMPEEVTKLIEKLTAKDKPKVKPIPTIAEFSAEEKTIINYNFMVTNNFYKGSYENYVSEKYNSIYR